MNGYVLCFPYCYRRGGGQNYTIIRADPFTTFTAMQGDSALKAASGQSRSANPLASHYQKSD